MKICLFTVLPDSTETKDRSRSSNGGGRKSKRMKYLSPKLDRGIKNFGRCLLISSISIGWTLNSLYIMKLVNEATIPGTSIDMTEPGSIPKAGYKLITQEKLWLVHPHRN